MQTSDSANNVTFLVYPGFKLLDLAGPLQVFNDALAHCQKAKAYRTVVISLQGGPVESDTGLPVPSEPLALWRHKPIQSFLVVGGDSALVASDNAQIIEAVRAIAERSARVASVCTGAFLLAASGLLEGRRAVTHWEYCTGFAAKYPDIRVETDPIFIKDGKIWTSAGVTAGIDLALAMVTEDLGKAPALSLARSLVAYMVRPGGQSQFSTTLNRQTADKSDRFEALHAWLLDNLDRDLRVEALAERSNMSPRNFSRLYAAQTGLTPAKAVEAMRLEAARRLLEETNFSVERIARLCGFGDDERMRRVFQRALNIPPQDYRRRFQWSGA